MAATFALVCAEDLEGIVAKQVRGIYSGERGPSSWVKIKNQSYSQARGRHEFFAEPRQSVR
jgi:ATP-dependent DNA ligase